MPVWTEFQSIEAMRFFTIAIAIFLYANHSIYSDTAPDFGDHSGRWPTDSSAFLLTGIPHIWKYGPRFRRVSWERPVSQPAHLWASFLGLDSKGWTCDAAKYLTNGSHPKLSCISIKKASARKGSFWNFSKFLGVDFLINVVFLYFSGNF